MPKVICTRPNASNLINGVKFEPHERGVISEDISDEKAEAFLSIPGYELDGAGKKPKQTPADDAELDALRARAAELDIKVNGKWGVDRLKAEIEKAEEKKAADGSAAAPAAAQSGAGTETETNA